MKLICFLLVIIATSSCNGKSQNDNYKTQPVEITSEMNSLINNNEKLIENFADGSLIVGQWLNVKYINSLKKSGSAKEAQESIYLAFINFKKDSTASIIYNFHEGVDRKYNFQDNQIRFGTKSNEQFVADFIDLTTMIVRRSKQSVDTLLRFESIDSERNNLAINTLVFKGKYRLDDKTTVEFYKNGRISGWAEHNSYKARDDYYDVGLDVDLVYLKNQNDSKKMTWELKNDTLNLYDVICISYDDSGKHCMTIGKGDLVYQLIRLCF